MRRGTWGERGREEGIVENRDLQQRGKKERGQWHSVTECYTHSHAHTLTHRFLLSLSKRVSQPVSRLFVCVVCVCGGDAEKSSDEPSFISMTDGKFISFTWTGWREKKVE